MQSKYKQRTGSWGWVGRVATTAVVCGMSIGASCDGAGLLVADGGLGGVLEMRQHDVTVTINNGLAVTRVEQVFHNTEKRQVEALYTFPVPKGASVANFSMWINGKEMVGEVVEKERAREIYNSYKRVKRDPGLLEQVDYKTFEMRIFPIGPEADQRVEVVYYQELDVDHDAFTYVYPLATVTKPGIDARVQGPFSIDFHVKSAIPITSIKSASHGPDFIVASHTESYWQASLEKQEGSLARDVVLAGQMARPVTGVDMIASRRAGEDGYFLMTITAGEDLSKLETGMDYLFLLDISGSMGDGGKLLTSKDSVNAFVEALGEKDRFDVLTFNVKPDSLFGALREASDDGKREADTFVAGQRARGGTNLRPALEVAYRYAAPDRPLSIVILSDGMTEQGNRAALLSSLASRPAGVRIFCIGVGNEVNRPLLEQLAEDTQGLAAFISKSDDFSRQAQAFKRKLMRPVATDVAVDFGKADVYDVEPIKLPPLYYGAPIRIFGRYRGQGACDIKVKGDVRGFALRKGGPLEFPAVDAGNPEIERSWAWRRVDRLLKQADRGGSRDSVKPEIIELGESYSIVTEYTSFLVLENDAEFKRWKISRRNLDRTGRDRRAQQARAKMLDELRTKAAVDMGPGAMEEAPAPVELTANKQVKPTSTSPRPTTPRPAPSRNRGFDIDLGTGPVGPLVLLLAAWQRRRRKIGIIVGS